MPLLIVLVLLTPITLTLVSVVTSTVAHVLAGGSQPTWWAPMRSGVDTLIAMGALGVLLGKVGGDDTDTDGAESGADARPSRQRGLAVRLGLGCLVGVGVAALVNPAFSLAIDAMPTLPEAFLMRLEAIEALLSHRAPMDVIAQAIGICVLPGVMEEWVFRQRLGRLLMERTVAYRAIASSAVFALIHLDPLSMAPLFVVGLVLFGVHRRWGYPAAAVTHVVFNLFGIFVWNRCGWAQSPVETVPVVVVMLVGAVSLAAIEMATRPSPEMLSVQG